MTVQRITLVISSLTSGGAERVMTTMANYWATNGRTVTLLTMTAVTEPPFYPLSAQVNLVQLALARSSATPVHALWNNHRRIRKLRREITESKPDVVVSFLDTTNVATLIATRGTGLPVIVAEHTDPGLKKLHPVWSRLRAVMYPRAAKLVILSESAKAFFPDRIQHKTQIIPNPIDIQLAGSPSPTGRGVGVRADRPHIVSMGRFGPEKGFDRLIDAFSQIADRLPGWDLVIWGDGQLRTELTAQRDQLGLTDRIRLPGKTAKPHDELRRAEIYALPSRREGFPMALAEALACGLPAVAFDISSGVRDILRANVDGLLVPNGDTQAFAESLASLMSDPARRSAMAARAPEVLDRFGVDQIMTIWNDLLLDVTLRR